MCLHIYICKLKETRPSLEMYKQLVYNTLQIENKIAIGSDHFVILDIKT